LRLIFVCKGYYPDEHAAAIRHTTLARGLVENGHSVDFLLLNPQHWEKEKTLIQDGISYTELNSYRGNNKLLRLFHFTRAVYKAKKNISQKAKQKKIDAVVLLTVEFFSIKVLIAQVRKLGIKVFHERTELPYATHKKSKKMDLILTNYYKQLPGFNGIFVVNDKLGKFIQQFNPNTPKLVTVVDVPFFNSNPPRPYPFPYIGYCGTIGGEKDGVPILVEAFSKITSRFPDLKLVLAGNTSNKAAIQDTINAVERFKLQDKIIFTGQIEREEMPGILCNAEILVVAKPDNELNSGNFPIKIGEYLATGVPVVVTSVGEIPQFIKDGESGFLAVPSSAESFAQKMEEALSNKERAGVIGQKGKKVAEENFDYRKVAGIMAKAIKESI
jgi:glycosyltransferase involved in cell wall biosynthesis